MKVDIFLEGGGIWGLAYLGAYKALSDAGLQVDRVCGISVGSIVGSFMAVGFTANELIDLLGYYPDFSFLKVKTPRANRPYIGKLLALLFNRGIYDSSAIEDFIEDICEKKGITTFEPLISFGESRLKILAFDATMRKIIVLPDDLPKYGRKVEDFRISEAVRMSCAIPLYYTPYELKTEKKTNRIIDVGFIKRIPTNIMYQDRKLRKLTLRFCFQKDKGDRSHNRRYKSPWSSDELERYIVIPIDRSIGFKNFDLTKEQVLSLYKQGYRACRNFLRDEFQTNK